MLSADLLGANCLKLQFKVKVGHQASTLSLYSVFCLSSSTNCDMKTTVVSVKYESQVQDHRVYS